MDDKIGMYKLCYTIYMKNTVTYRPECSIEQISLYATKDIPIHLTHNESDEQVEILQISTYCGLHLLQVTTTMKPLGKVTRNH